MLVSIALHAGLIYAISGGSKAGLPETRLPPPLIWFEMPAREPIAALVPTPEPLPEVPPVEAAPPEPAAARAEPVIEADAVDEPIEPPPAREPRATLEIVENVFTERDFDFDFEAEREKAVALIIEEQARERSYRTFSLDDLIDEAPPEDPDPGADQDVFAPPSSPGGRSAMRPGQARTRIGRAIGEICNSLGGIGVGFMGFGLFSLCEGEGERADFFGHLRPAYMEKLPVCTEQELSDAQLAAAQITDFSEIERTVVKCRLVDRDEVLVVPE